MPQKERQDVPLRCARLQRASATMVTSSAKFATMGFIVSTMVSVKGANLACASFPSGLSEKTRDVEQMQAEKQLHRDAIAHVPKAKGRKLVHHLLNLRSKPSFPAEDN